MKKLVALAIAIFAGIIAAPLPAQAVDSSKGHVAETGPAPEAIIVSKCVYFEGFFCINVPGSRGQAVLGSVTYDKDSGPRRLIQLYYAKPSGAWTGLSTQLISAGGHAAALFTTTVVGGCYQAAMWVVDAYTGAGVGWIYTGCLWK